MEIERKLRYADMNGDTATGADASGSADAGAAARLAICEMGRRMYGRGMASANSGNLSVRLADGSILCTPTGVSKGAMTPDMLCRMAMDGTVLEAKPPYRPSSEMKLHLAVYRERPDVGAVVHAHPPYGTVFAAAELPLDSPVTAEAVMALGTVPVAPYGAPSTRDLADSVLPYLAGHQAVLLAHHGALTWAGDIETAYFHMESLEFYAQLLYRLRLLGLEKPLPDEAVRVLEDMDKPGRK